MKKIKLIIGCLAMALASAGIAACADDTPSSEPDDPSVTPPQPVTYTVRFESEWGGAFADQTVESGSSARRPEMSDRLGWNFDGWYCEGTLYDFTAAVTGDITLTARFSSVLGGSGTAASPFTLDSAEELGLLKSYIDAGSDEFINAEYILTADIVAGITSPIPNFGGVLDGKGFTVTVVAPLFGDLSGTVKDIDVAGNVTATGSASAGLLANVASAEADITGVNVSGSVINSGGIAGGLVGVLSGGRLEHSVSTASVTGGTVGGLVGESSGVIINSVSNAAVIGSANAGGAVGSLKTGGLIQNVGAGKSGSDPFVSAGGGNAGGVVGIKQKGSAVYRAFVYGNAIAGAYAGGIVGKFADDGVYYTDVLSGYVLGTTAISGSASVTQPSGQASVADFSDAELPASHWDVTGSIPVLKAEPTRAPAMLDITVDGTQTQVRYGSNVRDGEMFDADDLHFSVLIELDGEVELKTVQRTHGVYADWEFVSAHDELTFTADGATLKQGSGAATPLAYVLTYAHTESFRYYPDMNDPASGYDVEYAAPISVYTDGEDYYAFIVTKQQIASANYIAYLDSFILEDGQWRSASEWSPKSVLPAGAYRYDIPRPFQTPLTYTVVVDGNYRVDNGEGYYLTRFVSRIEDEDSVTESQPIVGRGQGIISLGDSEDNAPVAAFSFAVDNEGYSDFVYFDGNGDLVNSVGFAVSDATNTFVGGTWFDGNKKYTFDAAAQSVTVVSVGDPQTVPYTVASGKLAFTVGSDRYELLLAPTEFGTLKLIKASGEEFYMASYISSALNGRWITENGDIITVTDTPSAAVTFNGVNAEANEALYNGIQAVRFLTGGKEYHLTVYSERGVSVLVCDGREQFAFEATAIEQAFTGEYVSVAGGERCELSIGDDLTVSFDIGGASATSGTAIPVKTEDGYVLNVTIGTVEYTVERKNDVIYLKNGDSTIVFTDSELFARFVGRYTSGKQILDINENGEFVVYARGGEAGARTALAAKYREERFEYGQERRGFVLSYTDGETEYFFYADADAQNVRLFRSFTNSQGVVTARDVCVFVPESALSDVFGEYSRTFNGEPDTLTLASDYSLLRTYTESNGTAHTDEEINWYPVLNYNTNTGNTTLIIYTVETEDDGTQFTSNITFTTTGLIWGMNSYISSDFVEAFDPYTVPVYINGSTSVIVGADRITVNSIAERTSGGETELVVQTARYAYDSFELNNDGTISLIMTETGLSITDPRHATATLGNNGGVYTITLTVGNGAATVFTGQTQLDYNDLVGEYESGGTTYSFEVSEFWGSISVQLKLTGSKRASYNYSPSNGITVLTDGTQAIAMNRINGSTAYTVYVWKNGDSLMISDSLDPANATEAENTAIAGMPSIDELKEILDGKEFVAADDAVITFNNVSGGLGGAYFEIVDGDNSAYLDESGHKIGVGVYTLVFGVEDWTSEITRYVKVYINDTNSVTKILVGETEAGATKEYLPSVSYPSVAELLESVKGVSYKAADGEMLSFSKSGNIYSVSINDGNLYDYNNDGTFADGVYTLSFTYFFSDTKTVTITYGGSGIVKVTADGKEYMPIQPPTMDELQNNLNGAIFIDGTGKRLEFELTSGFFAAFNIDLYDGDSNTGMGIYSSYTQDGNAYVLTFDYLTPKVRIEFDAAGEVKTITVDGTTYTALPTVEEVLTGLKDVVFVNTDQAEIGFVMYPALFGNPPTFSVTVGDVEYDHIDGSSSGFVYTINYESSENGDTIAITVTLGNDGNVSKITYNGVDYSKKA